MFLAKKLKSFNYIFDLPLDSADEKPYSFMCFKNKVLMPGGKKKKIPRNKMSESIVEEEAGIKYIGYASLKVKLKENKNPAEMTHSLTEVVPSIAAPVSIFSQA